MDKLAQKPTVTTTTGTLAGLRDEAEVFCVFRGIPYAEPPVGALRFMPPVPKKPFSGVFDAGRFGHAGPQPFDETEGSYEEFTDEKPGKPWVGNEDNLTLNVWTPDPDGKRRPVMVWIHGGANWLESSRLSTYHGDRFVARGDVVFVSLNYRLGIFGHLDMSVLGGDKYKGSHMNGLRDQITALRWIKENIAAFGGDPENITVMGESAGSIDISWLLTAGHLDGLAKRVVMMSGIAGLVGLSGDLKTGFTPAYGQELARDFLAKMNIGSMEQLLALSTDEIMTRVMAVMKKVDMLTYMDSLFWARVDETFAPDDPFRAAAKRSNNPIDIMIGYTAYEMGLWLFWDETLDQHACDWAAARIMDFSPAQQAAAVKTYGESLPQETSGVQGMYLLGDSIFTIPSYWFADEYAHHGGNVWMYQFDWQSNDRQRALHAADQAFMFGKLETHAASHLIGLPANQADREKRAALSRAMQDSILAFVRGGDPNTGALPAWPKYDAEKRSVMLFNTESEIKKDPVGPRRRWWYDAVYKPALDA